jgi:hypothetical protein
LIGSASVRRIAAGIVATAMGLGTAAPSMALEGLEGLEKDFRMIRACGGDVWQLCSGELPDLDRVTSCVQDKMGDLSKPCLDTLLDAMAGSSFKVCKDQAYALCAAAQCNVYDGVAYCVCDEMQGDSISLPFIMGEGDDVCDVMAEGPDNNYLVSTYSLPESITTPQGGRAIYTCEGDDATGAYAQCDGGLCFRATAGHKFPGFDDPVPEGQLICSCPITQAAAGSSGPAFQLLGPYPCEQSFFEYCGAATANQKTGSTIYVGAPAGAVAGLAAALGVTVPPLNECVRQ